MTIRACIRPAWGVALVAAVLWVGAVPRRTAAQARRVVVRDLGTLVPGDLSFAYSVNQAGIAAGESLGNHDTGFADLPVLFFLNRVAPLSVPAAGSRGIAFGVTDNGLTGGLVDSHAALWRSNTLQLLPQLAPGALAEAFGLNARAQLVGIALDGDTLSRPALWDPGQIHDLGTLPGDAEGLARAINNRGLIVGNSGSFGARRAVTWDRAGIHALPAVQDQMESRALAVNEQAIITGWWRDMAGNRHAVLFQGGVIVPLPDDGVDAQTLAVAVNNRGVAAGFTQDEFDNPLRLVLWDHGHFVDLSALIPPEAGWSGMFPYAINDQGRIVGDGDHAGFGHHAFMVIP